MRGPPGRDRGTFHRQPKDDRAGLLRLPPSLSQSFLLLPLNRPSPPSHRVYRRSHPPSSRPRGPVGPILDRHAVTAVQHYAVSVCIYNIYIIYNYMYIVYIQQVVKVLKNIYVINYKSNYHPLVNSLLGRIIDSFLGLSLCFVMSSCVPPYVYVCASCPCKRVLVYIYIYIYVYILACVYVYM